MHQNKNSNASAFSALDKSYDKLGKVFNFRWCKIDMNKMYEIKTQYQTCFTHTCCMRMTNYIKHMNTPWIH